MIGIVELPGLVVLPAKVELLLAIVGVVGPLSAAAATTSA